MTTIERPTCAPGTSYLRGLIFLVAVLSLCGSFPTSGEARGRLLGRRHRAACCAPAPTATLCCQPMGGQTQLTDAIYHCPTYRMGQVGDLWLYYSCQWTPFGCGPNPQPMYLSNPNAQGCPSTYPGTTPGHYCIQTGGGFGRKVADDGCKKGYTGDVPTFDPAIYETIDKFTGMFEHDGQKFQIRFFKLKLLINDFVFGVGYEDVTGSFMKRDETIECCGKKGFDVTIDGFDYHVLLHRDSESKCKRD